MPWVRLFFILLVLPWYVLFEAECDPWSQGWSLKACQDEDWQLIQGQGNLSLKNNRLNAFLISDSTAQWRLTTEPIWVYRYSQLKMRYRTRGLEKSDEPLLRLQIQPVGPWNSRLHDRPPAAYHTIQPATHHTQDDTIHEIEVSLEDFPYPCLDQIILTVHSGPGIGILEILDLSFHIPEQKPRPLFPFNQIENVDFARYQTLPLDKTTEDHSLVAEIPFQTAATSAYQITSMSQRDHLAFEVNDSSCSEIYLLMTSQLVGNDKPFEFHERENINNPDQCVITKTYADGSIDKSFPYHIEKEKYQIESGELAVYQIPVNQEKELRSIQVEEKMSYGQILVAGVTINRGTKMIDPSLPTLPASLSCPSIEESTSPPELKIENNKHFVIENTFYRVELDTEPGVAIQSLRHKVGDIELLEEAVPAFSLVSGLEKTSSLDWVASDYRMIQRGVKFSLHPRDEEYPLRASLSIQATTGDELHWQLQIQNTGYTPHTFRLLFPDLRRLRLNNQASNDVYLYPQHPAIWGTKPIRLDEDYSGTFPLRFFDLYSPEHTLGFALHTFGEPLLPQRYRYKKREGGSWLGIEYGASHPITLNSKKEFHSPPTVLQFHSGDWHVPFQTHKKTIPQDKEFPASFLSTFLVYQDYLYGGTGLIHQENKKYDFQPIFQSTPKHFGGLDFFHLAGWAYSPELGFYGNYTSHPKQDLNELEIPIALSYEGYLADSRIPLIKDNAENWAIHDEHGEMKSWPDSHEIFMDPNQSEWRDYLVHSILQSASQAHAHAVLLNHIGWADQQYTSYRDNQVLSALQGEHALLQELSQQAKEQTHPPAILTEHPPNEQTAQFIHGSLDTSFHRPSYPYVLPINLVRFAFPHQKIFTYPHPGLLPRSIPAIQAKLAFFYGQGLWLKGQAQSWYSREFREFTQQVYSRWHAYADFFTSTKVKPFIPTLQPGLYANAFFSKNERIITLFNSSPHTLSGKLLFSENTATAKNVWNLKAWETVSENNGIAIFGTLHPYEVGCILIRTESEGN